MEKNYPAWAKTAWRFVRVFLAAFIAKFSIDTFLVGSRDVKLQVLEAAVAGGIAGIFKYWREGKEPNTAIHKLPL